MEGSPHLIIRDFCKKYRLGIKVEKGILKLFKDMVQTFTPATVEKLYFQHFNHPQNEPTLSVTKYGITLRRPAKALMKSDDRVSITNADGTWWIEFGKVGFSPDHRGFITSRKLGKLILDVHNEDEKLVFKLQPMAGNNSDRYQLFRIKE